MAHEIPALLQHFGLDPREVVGKAGVSLRLLLDPENIMPVAALSRLLKICVQQTGKPYFGFLVGARSGLASLGRLGLLVRHDPDVRSALSDLLAVLPWESQPSGATVLEEDDIATISFAAHAGGIEAASQISEAGVALAFNVMRSLCGASWAPLAVLLPRREPVGPAPYRDFFRCPVSFGRERATMTFSSRWLHQAPAGTSVGPAASLLRGPGELGTELGSWEAMVRRVIRMHLLRDEMSAASVARSLGVHRRTLFRRLKQEGVPFQAIVEDLKFENARHWMKNADIPTVNIATALGYSEAASFIRAFRRWSGDTPKGWRLKSRCRLDA